MKQEDAIGTAITRVLRLGRKTRTRVVSLWVEMVGTAAPRIVATLHPSDDPWPMLTALSLTGVRRHDYPATSYGGDPHSSWSGQLEPGLTVTIIGQRDDDATDQSAATAATGAD